MESSELNRCIFILSLASVALGGCTGTASQALSPQGGARLNSAPLAVRYEASEPERMERYRATNSGGIQMPSDAVTGDLLYVSNLQDVTVYSYPKGKHVGTLRGFSRPEGECADSAGDVFIANRDTVVEYKHGGTKPIRTFTFSGYGSGSCASDPTTGNLAVTWNQGLSPGYVAIYQHARGSPTLYSDGDIQFNFCGYDNKGNLFVDGVTAHGDAFSF